MATEQNETQLTFAREKAAQVWCRPETSHKVMDVELAEAFAQTLTAEIAELREQSQKLKDILDSFGIEIFENGDYQFKPSSMAKFRKAQHIEEMDELREQLRQWDEMLAAIDDCEIWIDGTKIRKCHDGRWRSEFGMWSTNEATFQYDHPGYETLFEAYAAIKGIDNATPKLML
jgi:hypothetical protein